ncbi:uncharacterized protein LOC143413978 [Maylandia zebra]|uniref:uncharacterized protein LOC143413978 n=1 Tax=Maylandia zebra TaxID=106582 RepID=UPI00403C07A1
MNTPQTCCALRPLIERNGGKERKRRNAILYGTLSNVKALWQEVVNQAPKINDLKERWPALFDAVQINQEFRRITTVNLETTFMAKLDQYSQKIMSLLSSRGGAAKMRIRRIQNMLLEDDSVERRREVAIRGLVVYLREKEEDLFKEQDGGGDITNEVM